MSDPKRYERLDGSWQAGHLQPGTKDILPISEPMHDWISAYQEATVQRRSLGGDVYVIRPDGTAIKLQDIPF